MRRTLLALIAFVSACQEDPGVTVVLDDAGQFVRVDASHRPDAGDDDDDKLTTTPTE